MKSLTFTGIILLVVAVVLFYFTTNSFTVSELKLSHLMGLMAGIGIGLIFGGMVGYVSKGSAMRQEQKRQEIKQLRKEKEELERQAAAAKKTTEQKVAEEYLYKNPQSF